MVPSQTSSSNRFMTLRNNERPKAIITQRYGPLTNQQVTIYGDQDAYSDDVLSETTNDAISPTSNTMVPSPLKTLGHSSDNASTASQDSASSDSAPCSPVHAPSSTSDNMIVSSLNTPSMSSSSTSSDSQESRSEDGAPSSPVSTPSTPSLSEVSEEEKRMRRLEFRFTQGFDMEEDDYWAVVARRAERSRKWLKEMEEIERREDETGIVRRGEKDVKTATREELLAEMDWVRVHRLKKEPYEPCFVVWRRG